MAGRLEREYRWAQENAGVQEAKAFLNAAQLYAAAPDPVALVLVEEAAGRVRELMDASVKPRMKGNA